MPPMSLPWRRSLKIYGDWRRPYRQDGKTMKLVLHRQKALVFEEVNLASKQNVRFQPFSLAKDSRFGAERGIRPLDEVEVPRRGLTSKTECSQQTGVGPALQLESHSRTFIKPVSMRSIPLNLHPIFYSGHLAP